MEFYPVQSILKVLEHIFTKSNIILVTILQFLKWQLNASLMYKMHKYVIETVLMQYMYIPHCNLGKVYFPCTPPTFTTAATNHFKEDKF